MGPFAAFCGASLSISRFEGKFPLRGKTAADVAAVLVGGNLTLPGHRVVVTRTTVAEAVPLGEWGFSPAFNTAGVDAFGERCEFETAVEFS